jgi:hypothetical protein
VDRWFFGTFQAKPSKAVTWTGMNLDLPQNSSHKPLETGVRMRYKSGINA